MGLCGSRLYKQQAASTVKCYITSPQGKLRAMRKIHVRKGNECMRGRTDYNNGMWKLELPRKGRVCASTCWFLPPLTNKYHKPVILLEVEYATLNVATEVLVGSTLAQCIHSSTLKRRSETKTVMATSRFHCQGNKEEARRKEGAWNPSWSLNWHFWS